MKFFDSEQESPWKDALLLLAGFGLLFFQFLGRLPLIDPDEGRYVEIPREMLERGDFLTPTLNYVKYFEKPPLHYWLNALSLTVFGENEFAARFAGTLCGLLTVLVTYYLGRRLFDRRTGLAAATVLGTAIGFVVQARINFTDMTLTFCLSSAFAFFLLAQRDGAPEQGKERDYYLFYASMALAVLAKGLIGIVLPGGVIFCYFLFTRRWRILKEMRLFTGGILFLTVCGPWFLLVSLKNPEFARFFFIHEHFERFLTKTHHRYQPIWFFVPILAGTLLPWSMFIPAALKKGWAERKGSGETLYLLLWAGVIFAFFSKSNSKLVPYILPVFPPLALLIGRWFAENRGGKGLTRSAVATGVLLIAVGIAAIVYPNVAKQMEIEPLDGAIVGGLLLCQGIFALAVGRRGESRRLFLGLAGSSCLFILIAPPIIYARVALDTSCKELARAINERAGQNARVACYGRYEQGIAFYTHRRVIMVGDPDELDFGRQQGDNAAWFVDKDSFLDLWESSGTLFTVMRKRDLPTLQRQAATPVEVVASYGDRVLVTNRPRRPRGAAGTLSP